MQLLLIKILGKRRLAYEIKDFREGLYHIVNVEANDDAALKEFDRLSKINAEHSSSHDRQT